MHTESPKRHIVATLLWHSALNATSYALAQGINFLLQLWFLHSLGKGLFGELGIAQLCVVSVIFIAEFGMPSYFIRHIHGNNPWGILWRRACRFRKVTALLSIVCLLLFLHFYYPGQSFGLQYVLAAIPGILLAAHNPTPILIAQHKNQSPAVGLLILWLVCAISSLLVLLVVEPTESSYWLGGCLSLGYAAQYIFLRLRVTWDSAVTLPARHEFRHMLKQSSIIWLPSVIGTLYSLILPLIVESTHIEMLPYFLIGTQILQGISGMNMQLQRLLLPIFLGAPTRTEPTNTSLNDTIFSLFALLVTASITGALTLFFAVRFLRPNPALAGDTLYFCMLGVEWIMAIISSFLITVLLAKHRENFIFKLTISSFLASMALQLGSMAWLHSLLVVMILRLATSLIQTLLSHREAGIRFSKVAAMAMLLLLLTGTLIVTEYYYALLSVAGMAATLGMLIYGIRSYRRLVATS